MSKNHQQGEGTSIIPSERIVNQIFIIRGKKVMLDSDLAELYEVETKSLNRVVKRNITRFPNDFMFQLTKDEVESLRYQLGTSNTGRGGRRYLPLVFTEHGVLMLSSVLKSERATQTNIQIVRTFAKLREMLSTNTELQNKLEEMEHKYDKNFTIVFKAYARYLDESNEPPKRIGFGVE